ncbi:MAG: hypothetical protein PHO93_03420 [Candidatus Saccharimonadaceae bacterium]|nr:hypothetical protein [Candidatus Saccharimonadaceae bacterium]
MVEIGNKIVYRNSVCTVIDVAKKYKDDEDYYVLSPTRDPSLFIRISINKAEKNIRSLMTKSQIENLIRKIPEIPIVPIDTCNHGTEYKELLSKGTHEDLIVIIKTARIRQQIKTEKRQKINESDKTYFRQAEQLLYNEIAATLDISYNDAKNYVIEKVFALTAK